jgi:PGF-CTERM protein
LAELFDGGSYSTSGSTASLFELELIPDFGYFSPVITLRWSKITGLLEYAHIEFGVHITDTSQRLVLTIQDPVIEEIDIAIQPDDEFVWTATEASLDIVDVNGNVFNASDIIDIENDVNGVQGKDMIRFIITSVDADGMHYMADTYFYDSETDDLEFDEHNAEFEAWLYAGTPISSPDWAWIDGILKTMTSAPMDFVDLLGQFLEMNSVSNPNLEFTVTVWTYSLTTTEGEDETVITATIDAEFNFMANVGPDLAATIVWSFDGTLILEAAIREDGVLRRIDVDLTANPALDTTGMGEDAPNDAELQFDLNLRLELTEESPIHGDDDATTFIPGFEAILAVISLLGLVAIFRRRH